MGCTRSTLQPLICKSDEGQYIAKEKARCQAVNQMIQSSQSGTNVGLINFDSKETFNGNGNGCSSSWFLDKLPELVIGGVIFIFVVWVYRKYSAYRQHYAIRRAVVGDTYMSTLPTISNAITAPRDYGYLDK